VVAAKVNLISKARKSSNSVETALIELLGKGCVFAFTASHIHNEEI
jgi:hypothetical protein